MQANLLPHSDSKLLDSTTNSESEIPLRARDRLDRIKWENIAFMGFQVWFLSMAIDAVKWFFHMCIFDNIHLTFFFFLTDGLSKHSSYSSFSSIKLFMCNFRCARNCRWSKVVKTFKTNQLLYNSFSYSRKDRNCTGCCYFSICYRNVLFKL